MGESKFAMKKRILFVKTGNKSLESSKSFSSTREPQSPRGHTSLGGHDDVLFRYR